MSNTYKILLALSLSLLASYSVAHSGRTDSNGGHNCSQKSKDKGLCTGYHSHNGVTSTALSATQKSTTLSRDTIDIDHKTGAKTHSHPNQEGHIHQHEDSVG